MMRQMARAAQYLLTRDTRATLMPLLIAIDGVEDIVEECASYRPRAIC